MCQNFYSQPIITYENKVISVEYPNLKKSIETDFSGMNCYQIAGELKSKLIQNPLNTRLQQYWQCYIKNKVYQVVKQKYVLLKGYLCDYSLETLYLMTFNKTWFNFINDNNLPKKKKSQKDHQLDFKKNKLQFCIPTKNMIQLYFLAVVREEMNPYIGISNLGVATRSSLIKWLDVATNSIEIQQFQLLYECLAEFIASENTPCNEWTEEEHFSEISLLYQSRRGQLPTIKDIKEILEQIGHLIRNLNNTNSLDVTLTEEEDSITLIEVLASIDSPMNSLENNANREELFNHFEIVLSNLRQRHKNIIFLIGLLAYQQIPLGNLIGVNPATVSHTLTSILNQLIRYVYGETTTINSGMLQNFREVLSNFYLLRTQNLLQEFSLESLDIIALRIMYEFQFDLNNEQKNSQIQNEIVLLLNRF